MKQEHDRSLLVAYIYSHSESLWLYGLSATAYTGFRKGVSKPGGSGNMEVQFRGILEVPVVQW